MADHFQTGTEDYDEYLTEVGVPWIVRKLILTTSVVLEVRFT